MDVKGSEVGGIPEDHKHSAFTEQNVRWEEVAIFAICC